MLARKEDLDSSSLYKFLLEKEGRIRYNWTLKSKEPVEKNLLKFSFEAFGRYKINQSYHSISEFGKHFKVRNTANRIHFSWYFFHIRFHIEATQNGGSTPCFYAKHLRMCISENISLNTLRELCMVSTPLHSAQSGQPMEALSSSLSRNMTSKEHFLNSFTKKPTQEKMIFLFPDLM